MFNKKVFGYFRGTSQGTAFIAESYFSEAEMDAFHALREIACPYAIGQV